MIVPRAEAAGGGVGAGGAAGRVGQIPKPRGHRAHPQLLGPEHFTYLGAFRLPGGTFGIDTFDSSLAQLASTVYYDGGTPRLFICGQKSAGYLTSGLAALSQISIPTILDPNIVGMGGLNTASVVQNFADASDGHAPMESGDYGFCGGYVIYGGNLIGVGAWTYGGEQPACAFVNSSLTLASPSAEGPYTLAATDPVHGAIPQQVFGGYATLVPPEWRAALGAAAICGNSQWSIISKNSAGPAMFTLDIDTLITKPSTATPIVATPLAYYWPGSGDPEAVNARTSLGHFRDNLPGTTYQGGPVPNVVIADPLNRTMPSPLTPTGPSWTIPYTDEAGRTISALFADGTGCVLLFGVKGLGSGKYGEGTDDPALDGEDNPGDLHPWCYDPQNVGNKGAHAYPYTHFVWAYDVTDYIAAKEATTDPWLVQPYTGWAWALPYLGDDTGLAKSLGGVAWDATTRRMYLAQQNGDGPNPLIHVYEVA